MGAELSYVAQHIKIHYTHYFCLKRGSDCQFPRTQHSRKRGRLIARHFTRYRLLTIRETLLRFERTINWDLTERVKMRRD